MKKGLILQIFGPISSTDNATEVPAQVADLLKEFEAIFATPIGLPPIRGHEHQIQPKEGAQAIY